MRRELLTRRHGRARQVLRYGGIVFVKNPKENKSSVCTETVHTVPYVRDLIDDIDVPVPRLRFFSWNFLFCLLLLRVT